MTIKQVIKHLNSLYPEKTAEEWDNIGLIFGNAKQKMEKVMISLDLTTEVFKKALEEDVDLIVVHHPFIFDKDNSEKELELNKYKKDIKDRIKNTGIGLYVIHTNFDRSVKGMKQITTKKIGLPLIKTLEFGVLLKANHTLKQIEELVEQKLNTNQFITNISSNKVYENLAILPGAGSIEGLKEAKKEGCDIVLTSDVKRSTWIYAKEEKIDVIQISHDMENIMIDKVFEDLNKLRDVKVISHFERIVK